MVRTETAATILIVPALAIALIRGSGPSGPPLPVLCAFIALTAALGFWFMQMADENSFRARMEAGLAAALFAAAPATVAALSSNPDPRLIASIAAMAIGLTILRWRTDTQWHRWAALLPVALCIPLHRAGVLFAPLALADIWLQKSENKLRDSWPAVVISAVTLALHRADPWAYAAIPQASIGALASFVWPFDSSLVTGGAAGWSLGDGSIAVMLLLAAGIAGLIVFRLKAAAFGVFWFLLAILVAPSEPMFAFPGMALALSSAVLAVFANRGRAEPTGGPATIDGESQGMAL